MPIVPKTRKQAIADALTEIRLLMPFLLGEQRENMMQAARDLKAALATMTEES